MTSLSQCKKYHADIFISLDDDDDDDLYLEFDFGILIRVLDHST